MPSKTSPVRLRRDWEAIARDYAADVLSVPELCALHAVSVGTLYRYIDTEGLPRRRKSARGASQHSQCDLSARLLAALDLKMTEFENRMRTYGASASAADGERDARTLNTLVRLFEKVTGFQQKASSIAGPEAAKQQAGAGAAGGTDTSKKDAMDADALRNALAQRLERLRNDIGG